MDSSNEHVEPSVHRLRTAFTPEQCTLLEQAFGEQRFPDIFRHEELAVQLGIPKATIQVSIQRLSEFFQSISNEIEKFFRLCN